MTVSNAQREVTYGRAMSPLPDKSLASARLAADVTAFEAAGGRIERLAPGVASQPLKQIVDIRAQTWKEAGLDARR